VDRDSESESLRTVPGDTGTETVEGGMVEWQPRVKILLPKRLSGPAPRVLWNW